jgi:di/tricarboxylate transporter
MRRWGLERRIALVALHVVGTEAVPGRNFARSLLFGIAVSASIGGVGTLIGTPPNLFLASFARENLGIEISFAQWLGLGVPIVAVFLPVAWVLRSSSTGTRRASSPGGFWCSSAAG